MVVDKTLANDLRESAVKLIHRNALISDNNADENKFSEDDYNLSLIHI